MTIQLSSNGDYANLNKVYASSIKSENKNGLSTNKEETDLFAGLEEGCTDGKDDGKIGLFNAAGHIVKGAGNTLLNAAKSCVMDENGDFSLGRTLLTAGTGTLCIAFPPLGMALGAAGAAAGAVQIAKGAYNMWNAKTDAEMKQACQNAGSGVLTAGLGAVGAKAGFGAMKKSAALENGTSAIDSLNRRSSFTIGQKLGALKDDAISSSFHGGKKLAGDSLSVARTAYYKAGNAVSNLDYKALNLLSNAERGFYNAKSNITKSFHNIKRNSAKENINAAKTTIGNAASKTANGAKLAGSQLKQIYNDIINPNGSYAKTVKKYGYENVSQALKVFAGEQI